MTKTIGCVLLALFALNADASQYTKKEITKVCERYAEVWLALYDGVAYYSGWENEKKEEIPLDCSYDNDLVGSFTNISS
jgi:hypothetical protein